MLNGGLNPLADTFDKGLFIIMSYPGNYDGVTESFLKGSHLRYRQPDRVVRDHRTIGLLEEFVCNLQFM